MSTPCPALSGVRNNWSLSALTSSRRRNQPVLALDQIDQHQARMNVANVTHQ